LGGCIFLSFVHECSEAIVDGYCTPNQQSDFLAFGDSRSSAFLCLFRSTVFHWSLGLREVGCSAD
jgi:hypothetical protein